MASEVKHRRRAPHRVRQGRCPPHPPRRQGPRRALRPRHRPGPHHAAGPRADAGAQDGANALLSLEHRRRQPSWPCRRRSSATRSSGSLEHVDLSLVRRGEKVTVEVPVIVDRRGRPDALVRPSTTPSRSRPRPPTSPSRIEVSIEGLEVGTQIHASDLELPEGSTLRRRPGGPDRQHHRRADRRGARGRAGRGRGRGRHRARGPERRGRRGQPPRASPPSATAPTRR